MTSKKIAITKISSEGYTFKSLCLTYFHFLKDQKYIPFFTKKKDNLCFLFLFLLNSSFLLLLAFLQFFYMLFISIQPISQRTKKHALLPYIAICSNYKLQQKHIDKNNIIDW